MSVWEHTAPYLMRTIRTSANGNFNRSDMESLQGAQNLEFIAVITHRASHVPIDMEFQIIPASLYIDRQGSAVTYQDLLRNFNISDGVINTLKEAYINNDLKRISF